MNTLNQELIARLQSALDAAYLRQTYREARETLRRTVEDQKQIDAKCVKTLRA